ncbi:MAG TPA: 16S rRNA (cytosine(1402)-N(4))-methyltransferase RsmH [Synergistaceae bacterium]|nr:16S rRNA (cytosine(1402)-N(4))-methyltransferase RsmH [Synergistaceae bacterium]HQH79232.1 16S rRNA (cytosine(1402)-N(4))-methyltransferase RsmH [Synergistaceae bacterium]HQK24369.1 16S rRNA (cytosine(1402)-N(4))-methyltransferase RsmH [Synergistaceae bacterium]
MISHVPVMLQEVMDLLSSGILPRRLVDATVGLGGYSEAFLRRWDDVAILGLDQDGDALDRARARLASFGSRMTFRQGNFSRIDEWINAWGCREVDGAVFDLGVSNMQLSEGDRGFSFQMDGPLDMRMDPRSGAETAADLLRKTSFAELARIFREYGEESRAGVMTHLLIKARDQGVPLDRTGDVVRVLREGLPAPLQRKLGTHPARKIFQALRIKINDELGSLERALGALPELISSGGTVVVVSYHSLEDRMVKRRFLEWKQAGRGKILTRKPLVPSEAEVESNYKARSAKARGFRMG